MEYPVPNPEPYPHTWEQNPTGEETEPLFQPGDEPLFDWDPECTPGRVYEAAEESEIGGLTWG